MRDIFESIADELTEYLECCPVQPGQKGMIALINGAVIGFDAVSLESAYRVLHPKLLKSYAIEAVLQQKKRVRANTARAAKRFLEKATWETERKLSCYNSVGLGSDYRFWGNQLVGSALEYKGNLIHGAFFNLARY